jgi:hypothetical protein
VTDPKEFPSDELLLTIDLVKENQKNVDRPVVIRLGRVHGSTKPLKRLKRED